jgi:SAM-dependent methyltransferase
MVWGTLPELIGPRHVYRVGRLLRWFAAAVPSGYVLDAGCGAGRLTELLARRGYRVLAVDGSEDFVRYTRSRIEDANLGDYVEVRQVDLERPDLPADAFDGIVSGEVMEHLADDAAAIRGLAGALKRGGTLALSVPAGAQQYDWLDRWAGHERRYDEVDVRRLLETAGLQVDALVRWGFPFMTLYERFVQRPGLARAGHRDGGGSALARAARSQPVTALFGTLFAIDERFEGRGRGTGFLVCARKP